MNADRAMRKAPTLIVIVLFLPMVWICAAYGAEISGEQFRRSFELPQDPEPVLRQILDRPEFKARQEESLIEWLRWWLEDLVRRALSWISERSWDSATGHLDSKLVPLVVNALVIGIVAVTAVAIVWALVKYLLGLGGGRSRDIIPDSEDRKEVIDSARAREVAASLADQGKYPEALIYTFRFVLLFLEETGRAAIGPAKTNREILAGFGVEYPEYDALAQMAQMFNGVRYGDAECRQEDYERFVLLSHRVTEEIGTP